jgi:tRNA (cmo5U34)-methyltransferase
LSKPNSDALSAADNLFANCSGEELAGQFTFDSAVARVFPDMIRRSVPGYAETVAMSGVIAGEYARDNTNLYDLGCSLGAVTLAMRHGVKANNCKIIGIDRGY